MASLAGCAGRGIRPPASLDAAGVRCAKRLAAVDAAVAAAGVADGSGARIAGHPELRATRFLCSLGAVAREPAQGRQWLALLEETARAARGREIANLPEGSLAPLSGGQATAAARQALLEETARCSSALLAANQADPALARVVARSCEVPDDYSIALRTVGLYPLTSPFVLEATQSDQEKSRRWFTDPGSRLPRRGLPVRYVPEGEGTVSPEQAGAILAASMGNPLRVPLPDAGQLRLLAAAYAPVLEQDVAGRYDRPGRVQWGAAGVGVDPDVPLAYFYPSWAQRRERPLLQLNYVFWYTARAGPHAPSIERGVLDGLVVRLTLGDDGLPVVTDFMLACGCYHGYAPVLGRVRGVRPLPYAINPFAPAWVADDFLPGRLTLEVLSGWHRVEGVRVSRGGEAGETVPYRLEDYAVLEALPLPGGASASVFDPAGVMKVPERPEVNLLFPMGIPSVGSLRQRGRQPTRLVGREHFDDPRLLERDFELP